MDLWLLPWPNLLTIVTNFHARPSTLFNPKSRAKKMAPVWWRDKGGCLERFYENLSSFWWKDTFGKVLLEELGCAYRDEQISNKVEVVGTNQGKVNFLICIMMECISNHLYTKVNLQGISGLNSWNCF